MDLSNYQRKSDIGPIQSAETTNWVAKEDKILPNHLHIAVSINYDPSIDIDIVSMRLNKFFSIYHRYR